jgi:hypothetical protein
MASVLIGLGIVARPYCLAPFCGRGADLRDAILVLGYLPDANFEHPNLRGAKLQGAFLSGGNVLNADLTRADLSGACLYGADLRGADLFGTHLRGALYSPTTQWPQGFDPSSHGALCPFYD